MQEEVISMPQNETPLWLFIMLIIITLLICTKSFAKGHHWCGDSIDGKPSYGLEKNFKGKPIMEDGHNRHMIPRCDKAEYEDKWGPKRVEYYLTEDGKTVRGIWWKACCLHPDGSGDTKYPYWEFWREY